MPASWAARGGRHDGRSDERGFTLLELMVVVLIIAILVAIAIPSYLGLRNRAGDRGVQSNVRNAFTATRIWYNGVLRYSAEPADMTRIEPAVRWTNDPLGPDAESTDVFIGVYDVPSGDDQTVIVGGRTSAGRCFFIRDIMGGLEAGTFYDSELSVGQAACNPPAPDSPAWQDEWRQS